MARKGINIAIASDTRAFSQGVSKGILDPLEDVENALEDVAKEGDRAGEKLEDAMRDAQRETEELADEHKELARTIRDQSRKGFRDFGDASDDGTRRAKQNVQEFKSEARQNFAEVTSSFDGSMDSIADLAQGTLGGVAGSILGPVGLIAGASAGAFGAMYYAAQANAEKTEQRITDMYESMKESGLDYLDSQYLAEEVNKIYSKDDDAVIKLERLQALSKELGINEHALALAFAGDQAMLQQVLGITEQRIQGHADAAKEAGQDYAELNAIAGDLKPWTDLQNELTGVEGNIANAGTRLDGFNKTLALMDATSVNDTNKALGEAYDWLAKMPKETTVKVNLDVTDLRRQVSNALTAKAFDAYVNARTTYQGTGKPVY